jgi:tetratricopeptide (TPR) repeat protein
MAKVTKGKSTPVKAKQKPAEIKKPKRRIDWMVFSIIALCFALYSNTIPNEYAMDDELVTSTNKRIDNGIKAIPGIFISLYSEGKLKYEYRPIVKVTYAIENQFFGVNPHISHLINILIYAFTCLLLFKILQRLMQDYNKLFLFFIVILFLAHPIHTEVVASLKNRDEMLSFMFSLITLNYLISYAKSGRWISIIMAFFFYLLAYLSKASALVFLAIFPLVLYYFTDISWKKLAIIFGVILVAVILSRFGPKAYLPKTEREVFFFENPLFQHKGIFVKFATGMVTLLFYLRILIFPHPLLFYYGYDMIPISSMTDALVIFGIAVHLALFVFALWKIKQKHILSFAIMYYLICISMFSNIVKPAMGIVAERFAYAASLGFCIVLAYFIFKFLKKDPKLKIIAFNDKTKLLIPLIILLIPYSAKTISRNTSWKDHMTLYSNDIKYLDNSAKANALIAGQQMAELNKLLFKGTPPANLNQQLKQIIDYYNQSIKIYPDYYSSYNNIGTIYFTVLASSAKANGDTLLAKKYYMTGIPYFKKAISMNPEYYEAYFNLAYSYEMIGKYDSAMICYRKNIALKSDNMRSYSNMANLYFNYYNNYDSAISINRRMILIDPKSDAPYINLGTYSLKRSDTVSAVKYYETALEKFPTNFNLAAKLSKYYYNRDQAKFLKYKNMSEEGKKEFDAKK